MKWTWDYIVDDNGKPVEEEVTEEEFNYRKKMIKEGVECLRQVAVNTRKQNREFFDNMNEEQNEEFARLSTKHGVVAITSGSYFLEHGKEMPMEDKLEFLRHLDKSKITEELDSELDK
jgi:uncharacterized membrane-anchored protein